MKSDDVHVLIPFFFQLLLQKPAVRFVFNHGHHCFSVPVAENIVNMRKPKHETSGAIMRTYRCNFHFSLLINMTLLLSVIHISEHVIFFKIYIQNSINKREEVCVPQDRLKRLLVSNKMLENRKFSVRLL